MHDKKTAWTGVRNYQARNFMRDGMGKGDLVLFYHSNVPPIGVVGIGKVASAPYPDPTQFEKGHYYDPKATKESPRWFLVDIAFVKKFKEIITVEQMKNHPALTNMTTLRQGNRLSVTPVTEKQFEVISKMAS